MEVSVNHVAKTKERSCLGRCKHFFWLGVTFDTVGAATLFTGVFSRLPYYDMFLYLGASMIFLSLLWWTFWYSGNIELPTEEALNSPYRLPSASTLEVLSQTINNRFTFTIGSVSNTFMRMRRRRRRRQRFLEGQTSLDMTVTGQVENQLDQDKDREEGNAEKGEAQDFGSKDLPKPEAIKSFKEACSQAPDSGDLGREASLPKFVKGPSTSLVQPFTPSPLDQPPTPVILTSKSLPVVSLASMSQTAPILTSKSQPVAALASTSQPLAVTLVSMSQLAAPLASTSQPPPLQTSKSQSPLVPRVSQSYPLVLPASQSQLPVPVASEGHPLVPVASEGHPLVPRVSQGHPLVPVASEGHPLVPRVSQGQPLVPVASEGHALVPVSSQRQLQNLLEVCQTGPPPLQASQSQSLATISLLQVLPTESLQTQPVDLQVAQAILELQTTYHTQQASQSTSLVQEIRPSQPPSAREFHTDPVALETPPPADQELTQDHPNAAPLPPQSPAPPAQAQQSEPSGLVPTLVQERKSRSI
ncbi:unnamed protein product [Rangifer tarandus platyrhynchus]|uniref:Uncharacterized protein n=2 Tax=Rangifer tarandus platyrhynchus TaxID=3082113 RepID=A0ABN8ZG12_RANTA|nr:unnamed protein product [Rangifer tarandus platyrhynchus]